MRKDAEVHAEEDKKKRQLAEVRNQADSMCYQVEKLIKEHDDKLKRLRQGAARSRDRKGPRGRQGRQRRRHQVGGRRVGAGFARLQQDAVRIGAAAGAAAGGWLSRPATARSPATRRSSTPSSK